MTKLLAEKLGAEGRHIYRQLINVASKIWGRYGVDIGSDKG